MAYIEPLKEAAYDTEDDKTCPIYVDFNELKAYNDEVVDWIYCEGSVINYPVCQGKAL